MDRQAQEWCDSPMVRRAIEVTGGNPADVMAELLTIMTRLEDRFPGLTFDEILGDKLDTPPGDRRRIRNTLRANGVCEADIALVVPEWRELEERRRALSANPYDSKALSL